MRLSIERKISIAFGAAILFVLLAGAYAFHSTSELVESTGWLNDTHQALDSLGDLLLTIDEAENAVRGYVLNGREQSLGQFRTAVNDVDHHLDTLRELHPEDPLQQKRVDTFAKLVKKRLNELRSIADLRRRKGFAAAQGTVLDSHSGRPASVLGRIVRRMQAEEISFLIEQTERSRESAHRAVLAIFASCMIGLVFLAFAGLKARRDVAARRKAEDESSMLAAIVESSDDCIIGGTLDGAITSWNRGAELLFGYSSREAVGKRLGFLIPPELINDVTNDLERIRQGKAVEYAETVRLRKDGTRVNVSRSLSPIRDAQGDIVGVSSVMRDISVKKQAEDETRRARDAALELARLKSHFTANVSHEIRTPMNAIIGMTELLLLETDIPPQHRDQLDTVRSSAEALLSLINDVLDFSKLEAGRLELEEIEFSLPTTLAETVKMLAPTAKKKGLVLNLSVAPEAAADFMGDPVRLRQVVLNLISNAIKFTQSGEVDVSASIAGETAQNTSIRVSVRDTGVGISTEGQQRLFRPFSQADGSTTRKYGGTGLGLAISKQIVEQMGGEMLLESSPGKGAKFSFIVALKRSRAPAAPAKEAQLAPSKAASRPANAPFRILVVDDNEVNQKVALLQLRKLGYDADTAPNGKDALDALERASYDLVMMDCQMPVMDGYEATRELRKREADKRRTPVVAMTANTSKEDQQRCTDAGMDDYIAKPFKLEDLSAVLRRWDVAVDRFALESLRLVAPEPEDFAEIIGVFLKDAADRLKTLRAAVAEARWPDAARQAHAVKGASGQVGARAMSSLAARIETGAKSGESGLGPLVEQLETEFARVAAALGKEKESHG